jgi:hypothetical protein
MIIAELRKMKWAGTLRDVHERTGVSEDTFENRIRNRQCTMCGSTEHFFYACPRAQSYKGIFTTAARAGGRQADGGGTRTRQQRYLEPAGRESLSRLVIINQHRYNRRSALRINWRAICIFVQREMRD